MSGKLKSTFKMQTVEIMVHILNFPYMLDGINVSGKFHVKNSIHVLSVSSFSRYYDIFSKNTYFT